MEKSVALPKVTWATPTLGTRSECPRNRTRANNEFRSTAANIERASHFRFPPYAPLSLLKLKALNREKGRTLIRPYSQSLNNLFASIVITTGTLVPSGNVSNWKIMRAWFLLLS
jgi:hypothetical protein